MLLLALAMVVMSTTATSFFWFLGVDDLGHISLNAPPHGAASCCLCYCSRFHCLFSMLVRCARPSVAFLHPSLPPGASRTCLGFSLFFPSVAPSHRPLYYVLPSAPTRRSIKLGSSNHTFVDLLLFPLWRCCFRVMLVCYSSYLSKGQ